MCFAGKLLYIPPSNIIFPSSSIGEKTKGKVIEALTESPRSPDVLTLSLLSSMSEATQKKGIIKLSKSPLQAVVAEENISKKA